MDAKLAKIYYSPQGNWKGTAAIKKLAESAKVPEDSAKKWLIRQALWQIYLVLSSYSAKGNGSNTPQDFTTRFNKPITLDSSSQYMVGLNRIVNMSFTWFNVNSSYGNQLIKYSSDSGSTFNNITFPEGVWNYTDFNAYIKNITKVGDAYPITLEFDNTTFRVTITLAQNYQLDLTASNFNDLIGFNKTVLTSETNIGPSVPNLSQDTDILNIHCYLINDSLVDGQDTDIIYSFATSVLNPSYSFTLEPRRVTFNPINKNSISSIRIYITDGKRRLINLNGADTSFSLILKMIE